VQRAHPSYYPKGMCPRWPNYQLRLVGPIATPNSSIAHRDYITFISSSLCCFFSSYSLPMRSSCKGHTPLIIQKGCARAGQNASRTWWAKMLHQTVPKHTEKNNGLFDASIALAFALANVFSCLSCLCFPASSQGRHSFLPSYQGKKYAPHSLTAVSSLPG
jgi:hypothetical protein